MSDIQKEPFIELAGGRIREQRSASGAYMMELEDVAWVLGMMTGTRTRGRKPSGYWPVKTLEQVKLWIAADRKSSLTPLA